MLHDLLESYLTAIESAIDRLPGAYVEVFRQEILSTKSTTSVCPVDQNIQIRENPRHPRNPCSMHCS